MFASNITQSPITNVVRAERNRVAENRGAWERRSNEIKEFGTKSVPIQTLKFDILEYF